jgi:hypothetical protein
MFKQFATAAALTAVTAAAQAGSIVVFNDVDWAPADGMASFQTTDSKITLDIDALGGQDALLEVLDDGTLGVSSSNGSSDLLETNEGIDLTFTFTDFPAIQAIQLGFFNVDGDEFLVTVDGVGNLVIDDKAGLEQNLDVFADSSLASGGVINVSVNSGNGISLDSVQVMAVPTPTAAAAGFGALGLLAARRRRRA